MNRILLIMLSVLMTFSYTVSSSGEEEADEFQEEAVSKEYRLPDIAPEIYFYGGYRLVHFSGSEQVKEFAYLKDSIMLGGELRILPLPHRVHIDIDIKNKNDYSGDISYAYKDIVLFRDTNSTLFHNLDNISLIDLNTATANPGVNIKDMGNTYGTKVSMNNIFLRLKTPEFPFHVYLDASIIDKNGEQQQRSLLGAAYFNNIVRASQKRDIDWQTKTIVVGANSHLGPVEVDISHGEKRFDVQGDGVFYDYYSNPRGLRQAGEYPHNLIPELTSSTNTLKLHTSYTGNLVASATFSKIDKENNNSGAQAYYFIGSGEVTWTPLTKLAFLMKYRHRETDIDNPDTARITNTTTATTYTYSVKNSISSATDMLSTTARYRPFSGLTLRGEYSYEHIRRQDNDEWEIPDSTVKNTASLSADLRIMRTLKLSAKYTNKNITGPAYNTDPDHSNEGKISLSWVPLPQISTLLSYNITREKSSALHYLDGDGDIIPGAENRDVKKDWLLGSVTFLILKDLSLTTSYAYIHNRTQQDITYSDTSGTLFVDSYVPYKDTAHNYALDLNYLPKNNITFGAGVSHTISNGTFYPDDTNLTQPVSIASFSELKTKETVYSASVEYRFKRGFATGIQYRYSTLDDALDNPYDDVKDGRAQIILLTLSKKW